MEAAASGNSDLVASIPAYSQVVLKRILRCASGGYGYVLNTCGDCGHVEPIAACGCGDRNCPNCGQAKRSDWAEAVSERFLPQRAFHVVFTLPHELNGIIQCFPRVLLNLLLKAAADTLLEFSRSPAPRGMGGTPFLLTVLHTWTQDLRFHPHVHALISAGAWDTEEEVWRERKGNFLFSVRALAASFRGRFLDGLRELVDAGHVSLPPEHRGDAGFLDFCEKIPKKWVVFSRKPYRGTHVVIRYFARYTNRIAISNRRILSLSDEKVTIALRRDASEPEVDSIRGHRTAEMTPEVFFLRYVKHILPKGFHRIRHSGLMAPNTSAKIIDKIRATFASKGGVKKKVAKELPPRKCSLCLSENTKTTLHRRLHAPKREDSS